MKKKIVILTLLFRASFAGGDQGYMKRGLVAHYHVLPARCPGAMTQIEVLYRTAIVYMVQLFFDTFNLRAQIGDGHRPGGRLLVHFDPMISLAQLLADSHKLLAGAHRLRCAVGYQNILMNTLGDLLWRWARRARFPPGTLSGHGPTAGGGGLRGPSSSAASGW